MLYDIRHTIYERRGEFGLTLVEMLIVVAIIALLTSMVIALAGRIDNQAKERGLETTFGLLASALQEYYEYTGGFPEEVGTVPVERSEVLYRALNSIPSSRKILEEMSSLLVEDKGGTLGVLEIYDPWGTVLDYTYVLGDNFPVITSAGPDRIPGTADDITSR